MTFPEGATDDEIKEQVVSWNGFFKLSNVCLLKGCCSQSNSISFQKKAYIEETMLNLAQAIGMSPETYDSNWPLFYKLYLAMKNNEG